MAFFFFWLPPPRVSSTSGCRRLPWIRGDGPGAGGRQAESGEGAGLGCRGTARPTVGVYSLTFPLSPYGIVVSRRNAFLNG